MGRLRVPWTSQPQVASAPDRSTAFGANCDYLWTPQNDKVGVPKSRSYNGVVGTPNAAVTSGSSSAISARPWSTVLVMVFPSSGQAGGNCYDAGNSTGGARLLAATGGSSIQLTWVASTVGSGNNQLVETGIGAFDKIAGVLVTTWSAGGHTSWFKRPGKPIYTWSESLAIVTPTDLRVVFNSSGAVGIELAAISAVSLNATQAKSLLDNPWQICAPLQRNSRVRVAGGGGSTAITATVGNSVADGTTVAVTRTLVTTPGNASAAGTTASLVRTVVTTPGNGTAAGTTAAVTRTIATTASNVVADGITASIVTGGGAAISATPGNSVANGTAAAVTRTLVTTPGNGAAAGRTAAVTRTITTTVGNAVAPGVTAGVVSVGQTVISCLVGNAVASGALAAIVTANLFSGTGRARIGPTVLDPATPERIGPPSLAASGWEHRTLRARAPRIGSPTP